MEPSPYDEIAAPYEERKRAGAPAAWSEDLLRRLTGSLPRNAIVLDLGCGHGFEVARMSDVGLSCLGLDLSLGMLRLAQQRAAGRLVQGDATRLPLRSASLDGVWSLHALLHVVDLPRALVEVFRVLKPGGLAALTLAVGEGVTAEPVPFQPDVHRQFVHWTKEAAQAAVAAMPVRVLASGLDTDGRTTLWLLLERDPDGNP